ncbi:MAG: AAA family ATPase [Candidatus Lokiarchaeota archaeon]|nr:AAA family ATPase [Candidatus Harpocratesius repetitus]
MNSVNSIDFELKRSLEARVKARYPYLWLVSDETERVLAIIKEIATRSNREAYVFDENIFWSNLNEWIFHLTQENASPLPHYLSAQNFLDAFQTDIMEIAKEGKNYLLIFPDFHFYIQNTDIDYSQKLIRALKRLHPYIKESKCSVIFLSHSEKIPRELTDLFEIETIRPPTKEELNQKFTRILNNLNLPGKIEIPESIMEQIVRSSLGLTMNQAERLFNLALVLENKHPEKMVEIVVKGKKGIIAASGALEFFAPNEVPQYLAGVEVLKKWLNRRKDSFSEKALKYGLPQPRGVFLLGIPGTGKSLTAKFIAGSWKMPLLRLDIGALYSSYVGATEQSLRQALHLVEATAPAILWIDEIEKAFVSGGGNLDAGVSNRVLGNFLTWMQENTSPVFVIATANNVDELPPELMRKGRFDEVFFLDLPNSKERESIFKVHIKNVKRDPNKYDLEELAELTKGFVGAEIEQVIKEAMYIAFNDEERDFTQEDLKQVIYETKPLSETKKEMIELLRVKVENHEAVLASEEESRIHKPKKGGIEIM